MNHHLPEHDTLTEGVFQALIENGLEGLSEALRLLLNEVMKLERTVALQATPYERSPERQGYANGFKPKTLRTRVGTIALQVPQVRGELDFYPSCLEKGTRSEKALNLALCEMYINGVSTRKVTKIVEKLCGFEVSSSQVSRLTESLDEGLEKWRSRQIGKIPYLIVDARYEKVRVDGLVRDCALLVAIGVDDTGHRTVLGTSVSLSEAEVHWREFLKSLSSRGLHGLELITSDSHTGLKAARKSVFPGTPWQRCQFHLQQNAANYIPKKDMTKDAHADIKAIFDAPSLEDANTFLAKTVEKYSQTAPKLATWIEENIPEGLSVFALSSNARRKLRTTNMVERQNKELARRTKVVSIFPNEESLLRLASALLMEQDEEWQSANKVYITM